MKNGDVLLLEDGRMARVLELDEIPDLPLRTARVQFSDASHEEYLHLDRVGVEANLGSEPEIIANFYSVWGIHNRLNKMGLQ